MKLVAITSPDHRPGAKSWQVFPYPAGSVSSAAESRCGVAKAVVAIVEMEKTGTDRFGYGGVEMRIRLSIVMRRGAGLQSVPTARSVRV